MALNIGDLYIQHHAEILQRTSLLLTHARYARLTSRYIGLIGESERMGVLEVSIAAHEARLLNTSRSVMEEIASLKGGGGEGLEAWSRFVSRRREHNHEVTASLNQLRQIQRVVSQESVMSPTGVTPPTVFHGINQQSFLSTTSDVAEHYYRTIAAYAHGSVLADAPLSIEPGDVLVVHSHHPFPRQQSYAHADSSRRSVIARMPVWYGYTTRFHPNIAHEMAHPVVNAADESNAASASGFRRLKRSFEVAIARLFGEAIGRNRVLGFANLERVILDECLSDVLALRVAGPAYLASLAVSVAGTRPLSKVQALEPPLSVRLRVLLVLAERWYPAKEFPTWHEFAELLREYLACYDAWLKTHDAAPKLAYQRLLHRIVSEYIDGAVAAWHLDQPPASAGAAEKLGPRFRGYLEQQLALDEFRGVCSPADVADYEHTLQTQSPLAVGPNVIWLTYLTNPAYLRSGPGHLPEGRLFHEWCRLVKEGDRAPTMGGAERPITFQFGTYWEFLFFSVLWPSIQSGAIDRVETWRLHDLARDIISPSGLPPPVDGPKKVDGKFSVIGGFDILTLRQGYQAKVAEPQWPPVHNRYAYFTHRHLVQEVTTARVGDTDWCSTLKDALERGELLACVQVKYAPGTPFESVLHHALHWRAVRGDIVGIFRSLHWEDVVLLLRVSDLSKLLALSSWRADEGGAAPHRTFTQLLLPVDDAGEAASPLSRVHTSAPVRLSVHGRIANPDRIDHVRRQIAEVMPKDLRPADVLLCLGQDDLIATVEVRTGRDLENLLQILCALKSRGDLLATSTRILAAAPPLENTP